MSTGLVRPRTILYAALIALTGGIMLYALVTRSNSHLSVLHVRAPLVHPDGRGRRPQRLYAAVLEQARRSATTSPSTSTGLEGATMTSVVAKPLADGRLTRSASIRTRRSKSPVYVATPADATPGKSTPITFTAIDAQTGERNSVVDHFFGP